MGCVAFGFFASAIGLLWNVFNLIILPDTGINGAGIGMSTALGCGMFFVAIKLITGHTKILYWAIILSVLKILAGPTVFTLTYYLVEGEIMALDYVKSQVDDLLIWSLLLYASVWLWKNRTRIENLNETATTPLDVAPSES